MRNAEKEGRPDSAFRIPRSSFDTRHLFLQPVDPSLDLENGAGVGHVVTLRIPRCMPLTLDRKVDMDRTLPRIRK